MNPAKLKGRFLEYDEIKDGETKECLEVIHDMNLILDVMFKDPINVKTIKDKLNRDHKYYCSSILDDFMNYTAESYAWITTLETAKFYNEIYPESLDMDVLNLNLCEGKFDTSLCTFKESLLLICKNHINLLDKVRMLVSAYKIDFDTLESSDIPDYLYYCLLLIPEYSIRCHLDGIHKKYKLPKNYINGTLVTTKDLQLRINKKDCKKTEADVWREVNNLSVSKEEYINSVSITYILDYFLTRSGLNETIIKISKTKDDFLKISERYITCIALLSNDIQNSYRYLHLFRYLPIQSRNVWLYDPELLQTIHPYILLESDMKEAVIYRLINVNILDSFERNDVKKLDIEFIKARLVDEEYEFRRGARSIKKLIEECPAIFDKSMFSFIKSNCMFNILDRLQKSGIVEPN
jgi:hypothetical protein